MSDRTLNRNIRVRSIDDTTSILLGIRRTISGFRMEIVQLSRFLKLLANDEVMAGVAAGEMGAMMQLAIPVIGMVLAGISIVAGARITERRAAIPVGQTSPGEFRGVQRTGTAIVHEGEIIGRPRLPSTPAGITPPISGSPGGALGLGGGGYQFNFFDSHLNTKRDVEEVVNEMYTSWYEQLTRFKSS